MRCLERAAWAFARSRTEKLLTPMNRTLPASTSSSIPRIGSSIGIARFGPVELVKIDMICAQSPEASFCCSNQVAPPEIPRKHLSCEKHLMPSALDRLADDLFGSI